MTNRQTTLAETANSEAEAWETEAAAARPSDLFPRSSLARKPAGAVVLRVEGLQKCYGEIEAVAGLSFDVRAGEVFGLLGPNGAGKTSTIAMLATERRPTGGDAMLFGHSVCHEPRMARRMIGIVPQDIAVYPMLTAAENLRFFGRIYGVGRTELADRVDELLHFVGLESRRNDYVNTLSGGMKRRLNIAAALVHRPKLILLDEPTVGVDVDSREQIFEIVRRLQDDGSAILYTTHYMEEAERLCDRVGIMDQGKLVAMNSLDVLLANLECAEVIELRGLPHGTDLTPILAAAGVCRIEDSGEVVRLFVSNAARLLEPLQRIINRSRRRVRLKIAPPSLEHLFRQLTGKELRD
jgi:ABC-2 type transport system ATP-binding protein